LRFFDKAIKQNNINATKMRHMPIPVPPLKAQQAFVRSVEAHETAISAAETLLAAAPARKAAILDRALRG